MFRQDLFTGITEFPVYATEVDSGCSHQQEWFRLPGVDSGVCVPRRRVMAHEG